MKNYLLVILNYHLWHSKISLISLSVFLSSLMLPAFHARKPRTLLLTSKLNAYLEYRVGHLVGCPGLFDFYLAFMSSSPASRIRPTALQPKQISNQTKYLAWSSTLYFTLSCQVILWGSVYVFLEVPVFKFSLIGCTADVVFISQSPAELPWKL